MQNKAARVMMILKLWRWCWSIVRNFGVEKSRPPADQTKSHHGIKMPTWVSSELFIIEIPWTQYNLHPENNALKLWLSKAKVLALSVISKWFENFQTHSVFFLLCGRIAWIAYILLINRQLLCSVQLVECNLLYNARIGTYRYAIIIMFSVRLWSLFRQFIDSSPPYIPFNWVLYL